VLADARVAHRASHVRVAAGGLQSGNSQQAKTNGQQPAGQDQWAWILDMDAGDMDAGDMQAKTNGRKQAPVGNSQ
jgi:hypothetical protein